MVQKVSRVDGPTRESSRIWYPTVPPTLSHLMPYVYVHHETAKNHARVGGGGGRRYGKNDQRLQKRSPVLPVDEEAELRREGGRPRHGDRGTRQQGTVRATERGKQENKIDVNNP